MPRPVDPLPTDPPPDRSLERGQTVPLVALLVAIIAGLALLVGQLGAVVVDRAQAKNAADAAALAGAVEGEAGARRVAAANGGLLEQFSTKGGAVVVVTVRVGKARATSRAEPTTHVEMR